MSMYTRVNLRATIEATRSARDNAARAAQRCTEIGAPEIGLQLDELAAQYDKSLALLLTIDSQLARTDENNIPLAPGASPAK